MLVAAVFPGQGSHRAGALDPWTRDPAFAVVERVGSAIDRDLLALSRDETAGARTADAQPAIMAASLVAWQGLVDAGVNADLVAGHSLGEYTAAMAAGALGVEDGARVVAERGAAMGDACARCPGTMAAVVKLDAEVVEAIAAGVEGLVVANDNAPGQVVIAGPATAVEAAGEPVRAAGGRLVPLDVEGAFHSPAMAPAVERVRGMLDALTVTDPVTGVVTGVSGSVLTTADAVREALVSGILAPVRWRAVQETLREGGATDLVEVGPGGVLAGLAKRALPDVRRHRVERPEDVRAVVEALSGDPTDQTPNEVAP